MAYDCIPQDLLTAKLEGYGLDRSSLRPTLSYLSNHIQKESKLGLVWENMVKSKVGFPRDLYLDIWFLDISSMIYFVSTIIATSGISQTILLQPIMTC